MGYKFDERGFMVIPDPREFRAKREMSKTLEREVVVVKHVYCPNGHDLIWENADFNGCSGIRLRARRPNGNEGTIFLSPIFGDHTRVSLDIKLFEGEKLDILCAVCGVRLPVLGLCPNCENGELRALSLTEDFDIANGIAFCDLVGCPSSYILDSGKFINQIYLEEFPK